MMGPDLKSAEMKGIIPRMVGHVFSSLAEADSHIGFEVKVSFLEVYMERVKDLLNPVNSNLPIRLTKKKETYVEGITEVSVMNDDEVYDVIEKGTSNRAIAATDMNAHSSRSHSVFMLSVI